MISQTICQNLLYRSESPYIHTYIYIINQLKKKIEDSVIYYFYLFNTKQFYNEMYRLVH